MLSAAKHLAALSMIGLDLSVDAELSSAFEPCLNKLLQPSVGADLSAFAGCSAIPSNLLNLIIGPTRHQPK